MQIRLRTLGILLALASLMLGYFTAYCRNVDPMGVLTDSAGGVGVGYREPHYRIHGTATRCFVAPAHLVDRCIRPDYWDSYCTLDDLD